MIRYSVKWIILISVLGCSGKQTAPREASAAASEIHLKDLTGKVIDLKQYAGRTVFINVWATWCKPCIREMPSIERVKQKLKGNEIEFLLASNESVEEIENFAEKRKLNLRFVQLQNLEELNIMALPTTLILDRNGKLAFMETGAREWDDAANSELLTNIINTHE